MSTGLIDGLLKLAQRKRELAAGKVLFRAGDPVRSLFLVIDGDVRLVRALPHGVQLTLQRAGAGAILAEASLFAGRYHCEAVAAERTLLAIVPLRRVEMALKEHSEFARAWTQHLSSEVQRARTHAEILSLKLVSERVDAWTALNGGTFPPRGRWRHVASEIGVTPEALYREFAKRR
ncbi:MAG TPA: Crp/Fnr family transcriptional regulator [Dongiaceae bacterium]|nr:Crp/Fnr family transcriptional regulator [Dongiaceae bacterium]